MSGPNRPSDASLARDYLRDLAVDIRCARRDGLAEYAQKVAAEFRSLWPSRSNATIGPFGVPSAPALPSTCSRCALLIRQYASALSATRRWLGSPIPPHIDAGCKRLCQELTTCCGVPSSPPAFEKPKGVETR